MDAHRHTLNTDFIETLVGKPLGLAYFFIATPSSRSALQVRVAFLALIGVILLMIMQVFIDGDYIREIFIGGDYWVSYCVYAPRVAQRMTSTYMVHIFGIQCKDGIAERSHFFSVKRFAMKESRVLIMLCRHLDRQLSVELE